MTEFRFQRIINGIYKKLFLASCFRMHPVFILFRLVRFGQYIIEYGLRIRIGRRKRFPVSCRKLLPGPFFDFFQLLLRQPLITQQHSAELHQRIRLFYISQFAFITVQGMLVRIGV